jgi:hypothetical protein
MNRLKKIQYDCRKATFLIEKKQHGPISVREWLELKIHLAGCSVCRIFQRQSLAINRMIRNLLRSPEVKDIKMDEPFKKDLQDRIARKLNEH